MMVNETAELLVQYIGAIASRLNDIGARVTAAEQVFRNHDPQGFKEYTKALEQIRRDGSMTQVAIGLENLLKSLKKGAFL
jgi:hypothetical protein